MKQQATLLAVILLLLPALALAANPGHPASSISAGTFNTGDFTFPNQLEVQGNFIIDTNTFYVDQTSGRVGIGTTNPLTALYVNGSINVTAGNDICIEEGNCLSNVTGGTGGSGISGSGSSGQVSYWTGSDSQGGSNNLYWNTTSNRLGIGTDTPGYTLDVSGDINLPEANAIRFSGTSILRINTAQGSIAIGDTTTDLTNLGVTVVGYQAGQGAAGDRFTAQGYQAGQGAGSLFAAQGYQAGYQAGDRFATQGHLAGYAAGNWFAAQGYDAARNAGDRFAAQGYRAGINAGSDFVAQGYNAGRGAGSRFIAIGLNSTRDALATPAGINDSIALGYESDPRFNGHLIIKQANLNNTPILQGDLTTGKLSIATPTATSTGDLPNTLTVGGNLAVGEGYATTTAPSNAAIIQGSVGIGTSNPQATLDVNGTITTNNNNITEVDCIVFASGGEICSA